MQVFMLASPQPCHMCVCSYVQTWGNLGDALVQQGQLQAEASNSHASSHAFDQAMQVGKYMTCLHAVAEQIGVSYTCPCMQSNMSCWGVIAKLIPVWPAEWRCTIRV